MTGIEKALSETPDSAFSPFLHFAVLARKNADLLRTEKNYAIL